MRWTDIYEIAIKLEELYPDIDILSINFQKLKGMIEGLPGFLPQETRCNEKILEAVQSAWLEERG